MTALKKFRDNNGLKGIVQIHHIIPKSCYFSHSGNFIINLNHPNNLLLMPSNKNVFKDCSQDHRLDNKPRPKRTKQQEDTDYHQMVGIEKHDSFRRFKMEKYMIICELEVYNFI